jgi:predicted DNA-binding protein
MAYIKAELPEDCKNTMKELAKKKGETQATLCRTAILNYIRSETERTVTLNIRKMT